MVAERSASFHQQGFQKDAGAIVQQLVAQLKRPASMSIVQQAVGQFNLPTQVHTPLPVHLPLPRPVEPGLAVAERILQVLDEIDRFAGALHLGSEALVAKNKCNEPCYAHER